MTRIPAHPPAHRPTAPQNVFNLTAADLDGQHMDLVFFDAHVLEPQMHM